MKRKTKAIIGGAALIGATIGGVGVTTAFTGDDDGSEVPITGPALEQASEAALSHLGEGRVTDTEFGDEESLYEVEVTRDDGTQVDVQLDENFAVIGTEEDGQGEDD